MLLTFFVRFPIFVRTVIIDMYISHRIIEFNSMAQVIDEIGDS
jgi:hypothetical protein